MYLAALWKRDALYSDVHRVASSVRAGTCMVLSSPLPPSCYLHRPSVSSLRTSSLPSNSGTAPITLVSCSVSHTRYMALSPVHGRGVAPYAVTSPFANPFAGFLSSTAFPFRTRFLYVLSKKPNDAPKCLSRRCGHHRRERLPPEATPTVVVGHSGAPRCRAPRRGGRSTRGPSRGLQSDARGGWADSLD